MGSNWESPKAQAATILERLSAEYPEATITLDFSTRFELLVAVILSGQCTDERVNQTTPALFDRYDSATDFAQADVDEIADMISSITYPNQKAGWIQAAAERIVEDHNGDVPATMEDLTDLPGVGRKTANVVLQHGYDTVEGIVVDTHVMRLSKRLGLTEAATRDRIETELRSLLPEAKWQQFTHLLIAHGRAVCSARSPSCDECVLEDRCPSSRLDSEIDLSTGEPWTDRQ